MIPEYIISRLGPISLVMFTYMLQNDDLYLFQHFGTNHNIFINWWKHSPANIRMEVIEYILQRYEINRKLCNTYHYPETFGVMT